MKRKNLQTNKIRTYIFSIFVNIYIHACLHNIYIHAQTNKTSCSSLIL